MKMKCGHLPIRRRILFAAAVVALASFAVPSRAEQFNTPNGTNYTTTDSAFKVYWDSTNDVMKLLAAPVGTAGNSITWIDGLTMDTTGRIGIGTTSPSGKLHVSSGTAGDALLYIEADTDNNNEGDNPGIIFLQDGGLAYGFIQVEGVGGTYAAGTLNNSLLIGTQAGTGDHIQFLPRGVVTLTIRGDTNNVGIGTEAPQSTLHVPDGKYAQFEDNNAGAPPSGDCDADAERGRMSIDTTNNRLYICNGATRGWDYVALTN